MPSVSFVRVRSCFQSAPTPRTKSRHLLSVSPGSTPRAQSPAGPSQEELDGLRKELDEAKDALVGSFVGYTSLFLFHFLYD